MITYTQTKREPDSVAIVELKVEHTYLQLSRETRAEKWQMMQAIIRSSRGERDME